MVKKEVETLYIELTEQGDSGWIKDDTKGTPYEEKITSPSVHFIPNRGKMARAIMNGDVVTGYKYVPIQYIKGCNEIEVEEQRKLGYEPDDKGIFNKGNYVSTEDSIAIVKGKAVIKNEGDIGLFEYLKNVLYNASSPFREETSTRAKIMFKVIDINKSTETFNELDFLQAEAINYISQNLLFKVGKGQYKYHEPKIDNIMTVLNLFGEDYPQRIAVITKAAKTNPEGFLQIVYKLDQTTITEVTHALELNVIKFEGNSVEFVEGKKVVATVPSENKSHEKKINALSDLLRTPEYAQVYQELIAKIEIAQDKKLK
jgi:hypothetical protein